MSNDKVAIGSVGLFCLLAAILSLPEGAVVCLASPCTEESTVVLCESEDPYHELATEIAAREGLRLYGNPTLALQEHPRFLIWVVTPSRLSHARLNQITSATIREPPYTAVGLLTGSTVDSARALYYRGQSLRVHTYAIINAERVSAGVRPAVLRVDPHGSTTESELSKKTALDALRSDYVTVSCHASSQALILNKTTRITAADIPSLPGNVIDVFACGTACVWSSKNVALACIDRGAAAYIGQVFDPLGSYYRGAYCLPARYSFTGFPLGYVVLLRNMEYIDGDLRVPSLVLIGDPRIHLCATTPVHIRRDFGEGDTRTIVYDDAPSGVIHARITDGQHFSYVAIDGISDTSTHDLFANAKIQVLDIGSDKYVSFLHTGGTVALHLARTPPLWRLVVYPLVSSLDWDLILLLAPDQGACVILSIGAGAIGIVVLRLRRRCPEHHRYIVPSLVGGLICVLAQYLYYLLRAHHVVISAKDITVELSTWFLVFAAGTLGAFVFLCSNNWTKKVIAAALPLQLPLIASVVYTVRIALANMSAIRTMGVPVWDYDPVLAVVLSLPVQLAVVYLIYSAIAVHVHAKSCLHTEISKVE